MAIRATCDGCGKAYAVPAEMAGRRVRCKACGRAFTIGGAAAAATTGGVAAADAVRLGGDAGPAAGGPPPAAVPVGRLVGWFDPNAWVLLGLLAVAIAGAFAAGRLSEQGFTRVMIAFPVLGAAFLVVGTVAAAAEAARTPGHLRLPWKDLLLIAGQLALAATLGAFVVSYRRRAVDEAEYGPFYKRVGGLLVRSAAVALMSVVFLAVAYSAGTIPRPEPTALGLAGLDLPRVEQTKRNLQSLFGFRPVGAPPARSPFDPNDPDPYVVLRQNRTRKPGERVVAYDRAELTARGWTHALTNDGKFLRLSKDELFARPEVPR